MNIYIVKGKVNTNEEKKKRKENCKGGRIGNFKNGILT